MLIADRAIDGIGLGTAQFAFRDGSMQDSVATVHAAVDAGVALIDTALAYTRADIESYAEQVVAQALRGVTGEHPLIATKGGHWRDGDSFPVDGRPGTLRAQCEVSLRILGVDQIGLYQLHHVDPAVPLLDSVGARGVSVHRILLAWLRAGSPNIVPLAGAVRPGSITDSAALPDLAGEDLADLRVG